MSPYIHVVFNRKVHNLISFNHFAEKRYDLLFLTADKYPQQYTTIDVPLRIMNPASYRDGKMSKTSYLLVK